ncbi:hypothetical protein A3C86_03765 [Candidatus Kaiserbacteria bacterium RIFCSPHIGHO2_02_FULL_49_16]|uniref:site-specific DNA-methyltransferase (adenine-specific) n=1 Tax=Candidatus Kaiserbacteria bacterium RIFCSPHIGHO2_02_FULL_49_16 TaxID=1798490 RepID=A0A1F6D9W8_9BACT|nr:MAG: hypothetical protein A3C86_03765 [Candidatus Kaiserbacteria bacterium RIFCSPHIGHO2_02_FULL_49_16]
MSTTKLKRNQKRQMGQFLTPLPLASSIVDTIALAKNHKFLEPSMGDGSFIIPLIERFITLYSGSIEERLSRILSENIWGIELDKNLYENCLQNIRNRWGYMPSKHNLVHGDFFRTIFPTHFDFVVGNPPFGGSFDPSIEDALDAMFGVRNGEKIKKETYAFFIVKSTDLLKRGGSLAFICSDTFLTINTMRGLRSYLMHNGDIEIKRLPTFSDETTHPMVILRYTHRGVPGKVSVHSSPLSHESINKTGNLSFGLKQELEKYFSGSRMGDFFVATSGMTTGKNEYFVREIINGKIYEPYRFSFSEMPITLKTELEKARLGKLSDKLIWEIEDKEKTGATRRAVSIERLSTPREIAIPHKHYLPYNKANNSIIYNPPTHMIYWKDDGDAVLTYKKGGNWYLRGVGGQPYFMREGITWQLIASRMHMKYLPAGYILDSGAPCAFPREHVAKDEIYFALGWSLTRQCNRILKEVINHTKNIQGKDFERLPYPFWVSSADKKRIISIIKDLIRHAMKGNRYDYNNVEIGMLDSLFSFPADVEVPVSFVSQNEMMSLPF